MSTKAELYDIIRKPIITEKATMIAQSLGNLDDQIDRIDSVSDVANHRLTQGIETAVNGSTQISDAIRRGVETLTRTSDEAMSKATAQIEATLSHVQQLKEVGAGNVESVEHMVDLLERSRQEIDKSSATAKIHVEALSKAVDGQSDRLESSALSLADSVKSVSRSLEEPLRLVGIAIADADGRHEQIQTTLERRVSDLKDASDKATTSVETIRQSLREQTNDIASLSGKVTAQAKSLNEELSENRDALNNTVEHTLTDMTKLIEKVSQTNDQIQQSSSSTVGELQKVSDQVDVSLSRMNDAASFAGQALSGAGQAFVDQTETIENKMDAASSKIQSLTDGLMNASEKIIPMYDRVEMGANKSMITMEKFKDSYIDTATETITKMDDASASFDTRLASLQVGVGEASDALKSASSYLNVKLDDVNAAAKSANETMRTLANSMEGQSSDIHILTDQTILKVETIQKAINGQFIELSEAVGQAVAQIDDAGEGFEKRTDKMSASADDVLARFSAAGDEAETKAYALKQASQNVANVASDVVNSISKEMGSLDSNSEGALLNLRKAGDTLSIKSKEVDTMMKSVLVQAKSYSLDMREQVRSIAEQSDESANNVSRSISNLLGTMDDMSGKTQAVVSTINDTNHSLYEQSGRFVTAVTQSAQAAEQATDMFSRQSDHLLKSSRLAVEHAKDIEKTELRAGRDNFLSSARFVLESLHSLSIDFVRMIDGDVSDKDWKSYQKGDVAVFTSHVAKSLDDMPADKIRDKYAKDTEFRTYVQKFMRQFEDILEQTDTVDRGAVLSTTFAASDVGKIYRFLSNVTGREAKRKAA